MVAERIEQAQVGLKSLSLSEDTINQLRNNFVSIERYVSAKVENTVRILSDLREIASAESLDTFTLIYTNILEHQPDYPPEAVEKLAGLREGIPRKDANEVVQECKEISENSLVNGNPPEAGFVFPKEKSLSASKGSIWRKLT